MKKILEDLKDTVGQVFIEYSSEQGQYDAIIFEINEIIESISEKEKDEEIDADVKLLENKFGKKIMQELGAVCIGTGVGIDTLADFVKYRNEIKKPLKTARPLKAFAQELIKITDAGYDVEKAIEIMQNNEWQTLNVDWIAKKMQKPATGGADLEQFGIKPQEAQRLLK